MASMDVCSVEQNIGRNVVKYRHHLLVSCFDLIKWCGFYVGLKVDQKNGTIR